MGAHRKPARAGRLFLARVRSKNRSEAHRRQILWTEFRDGQKAAQEELSRGYQPRHAKKENHQ